jgi:hypothetical protein
MRPLHLSGGSASTALCPGAMKEIISSGLLGRGRRQHGRLTTSESFHSSSSHGATDSITTQRCHTKTEHPEQPQLTQSRPAADALPTPRCRTHAGLARRSRKHALSDLVPVPSVDAAWRWAAPLRWIKASVTSVDSHAPRASLRSKRDEAKPSRAPTRGAGILTYAGQIEAHGVFTLTIALRAPATTSTFHCLAQSHTPAVIEHTQTRRALMSPYPALDISSTVFVPRPSTKRFIARSLSRQITAFWIKNSRADRVHHQ